MYYCSSASLDNGGTKVGWKPTEEQEYSTCTKYKFGVLVASCIKIPQKQQQRFKTALVALQYS